MRSLANTEQETVAQRHCGLKQWHTSNISKYFTSLVQSQSKMAELEWKSGCWRWWGEGVDTVVAGTSLFK